MNVAAEAVELGNGSASLTGRARGEGHRDGRATVPLSGLYLSISRKSHHRRWRAGHRGRAPRACLLVDAISTRPDLVPLMAARRPVR